MERMKLQKFAPFSLYLSIIALLVSGSIYFVQRRYTFQLEVSLGICFIGLALYVLLDPKRVRRVITGRQAKYGNNLILSAIAIVGILGIVNYLAYKTSLRWDLTENKENSLSSESLQVLQNLPEKIQAQAFYTQNLPSDKARLLLDNYKFYGEGKFDYQFIDPVTNPLAAQEAKVTRDGTIVLSLGERKEWVLTPSEQEITSALIRLINPGERIIHFLTGHGEAIPQNQEDAYSQLREFLINKNYNMNSLNLLSQPVVPPSTLAVIILSPRNSLTKDEVSALKNYLDNGGALILLSEPAALVNIEPTSDNLWKYLQTDWGINCQNDVVIDPDSTPPFVVISQPLEQSNHPITAKISNMVAVFPTAHSLHVVSQPQNLVITELVKTTETSWGETDIAGLKNQQMKPDKETDLSGPLTLAIAAQNLATNGRLVVIGDADFANDGYIQAFGNMDFITNTIDWAAKQDNLINLTAKPAITRVLVPPTQSAYLMIALIVIILLPTSVILAGILVFLQRRRGG